MLHKIFILTNLHYYIITIYTLYTWASAEISSRGQTKVFCQTGEGRQKIIDQRGDLSREIRTCEGDKKEVFAGEGGSGKNFLKAL